MNFNNEKRFNFRTWDPVNKKMLDYLKDGADLFRMQCTGMTDMNDEIIYEGDIICWTDLDGLNHYSVVKYGMVRKLEPNFFYKFDKNDGIKIRQVIDKFILHIPSFYLERMEKSVESPLFDNNASYPWVLNYAGKHDLDVMEVVGNIYENDEILHPHPELDPFCEEVWR